MSQRAAARRRRQAVQGDAHLAPRQRKWAKPAPTHLGFKGKKRG